ncbi:glycerol-3-phosphate responsive antiterminator [Alkalicella caledoniensis]|uniref:Glycerol-3-phosphate responsive antiterminator n=1 Tax=Alkalicella caledoniensis TaxID=2731377 RepID=A0A7G9W7H1_ALKCA|nr:glycerol-3-phosphate responsive antiterminator [Alkalicella caledoniensis]QNO14633.1 glycerol-3-phosphate responsive antiterminator [Alkalicella caledoniensis]
MKNNFYDKIQCNPIISAVNSLDKLDTAIESPSEIVFLLKGNLLNLKETVEKVAKSKKAIYIHLDLIEGLSRDIYALKYIKDNVRPDGIITTKSSLVRIAKELDMFAIQRLFILDSLSLETGIKSIKSTKPDAVEILPGIMPRITKILHKETNIPIINGGLITLKEEVINSLGSGAIGISTTNEKIWYM